MIILQNLFPIHGNSFQRKPKLTATPHIYSSVIFISETASISEKIAGNSFGAL